MKKVEKGTLSVKILPRDTVVIRIDSADKRVDIAQHFYNQRLLYHFKKLLKQKGVAYIFHRKNPGPVLIIDSYDLVIMPVDDGRFRAYNKRNIKHISFSFEASNTSQIIYKLLRFKLIGIGFAKKLCDK